MAPFWDQTGDADGDSKGNYFPPVIAEYDLEIKLVRHKEKGAKGESVIVEVLVLSSTCLEVPVGTSKSTAWNLSKQPILAQNNIKSFICGVYGWNDQDKSPENKTRVNHVAKRMVGADNPMMNVKVHLSTWNKPTQAGKPFTACAWSPYVVEPGYVAPMPSGAAAPFVAPVVGNTPAAYAPHAGSPMATPPPPPAVDPRAGWRRENGHRLNPHTNSWELDAK
jgi:hypothetical protein